MKQEAEGASGSRTKPAADCLDTLKQKEEEKAGVAGWGQCRAPPVEPCALRTTRKITTVTSSFSPVTSAKPPCGVDAVSVVSQRAPLTETSSYLQ